MNDELSGQLALSGYSIPNMLQGKLALQTEHERVPVEGETGLFQLSVPAEELHLCYGDLLLKAFRWQPDNLEWYGEMGIAGSIEALTIMEVARTPITVLTVLGVPLLPNAVPYMPADSPSQIPMAFEDGVLNADEGFYTFLAPEDSALVPLAENALMNKMRVWLNGKIAPEKSGWHSHYGLPILLEGATLFAPM